MITTKQFNFRIPFDLLDELMKMRKQWAKKLNLEITLASLVIRYLREGIARDLKKI